MTTNTPTKWNPRYAAYAAAHGRSPEQQHAHDVNAAEFIVWCGQKLREFRKVSPASFAGETLIDHDAYTAWLTASVA